jgi:hypothetical protein
MCVAKVDVVDIANVTMTRSQYDEYKAGDVAVHLSF